MGARARRRRPSCQENPRGCPQRCAAVPRDNRRVLFVVASMPRRQVIRTFKFKDGSVLDLQLAHQAGSPRDASNKRQRREATSTASFRSLSTGDEPENEDVNGDELVAVQPQGDVQAPDAGASSSTPTTDDEPENEGGDESDEDVDYLGIDYLEVVQPHVGVQAPGAGGATPTRASLLLPHLQAVVKEMNKAGRMSSQTETLVALNDMHEALDQLMDDIEKFLGLANTNGASEALRAGIKNALVNYINTSLRT